MKRKFLSVLIALVLVLSFSSVTALPVEAQTTRYVATTGSDTTGDGSSGNPWATIGYAISQAAASDTISVAAGTYSVTAVINVNLANLTISGTGATTTTVDGSGKNASIQDGADVLFNVTASGVTIENLTIDLGDGTADFDVGVFTPNGGGIDDLTVQNCIFLYAAYGLTPGEQSIHLGGGAGATITGNTFEAASGNSVLYVGEDVSGGGNDSLTVSNNTAAKVSDADGGGTFFNQFGPVTNSAISGNTLTDTGIAVYLGAGSLADTDTVAVTGNTFTSTSGFATSYGALVITSEVDTVETKNITVTNNVFTGTEANGAITIFDTVITTADVDGSTIVINYNSFAGDNTGGGVNVGTGVSGTPVDAEYNWYGGVAGPQHSTNPYNTQATSQGNDSVSNDVDFAPWMIHDTLASGWNIWSTPIAAATGQAGEPDTNTITEALDFWDADSGKVTNAYYFDSSSQAWAVPTSLTPLQAVYLKLSASATIDVCISDSNYAPPGRTMHLGWNLVGTADWDDDKLVDAALLSAYYGTGAVNLIGYQYVISPSIHQTTWTFTRDGTTTAKPFVPMEGYWVYMVNQGVLNGFTYTPIIP